MVNLQRKIQTLQEEKLAAEKSAEKSEAKHDAYKRRIGKERAQTKNELADAQLKATQAAAELEFLRSDVERAAARERAQANAEVDQKKQGSSSLLCSKAALLQIIGDVHKAYEEKGKKLAAPAAATSQTQQYALEQIFFTKSLQIEQTNIQYNTMRLLEYNSTSRTFGIDLSSTLPASGSYVANPSFTSITDKNVVKELKTLLDPYTQEPIVNATCKYTYGGHTYDVKVVETTTTDTYRLEYKQHTKHTGVFTRVGVNNIPVYLDQKEHNEIVKVIKKKQIGTFDHSGFTCTATVASTNDYTYNGTSYCFFVVPTSTSSNDPNAASTSSSNPNAWKNKVLFDGTFFPITNSYLLTLLTSYDFNGRMYKLNGSKEIADLATLFSGFGQEFQYDANKCELWVKPNYLQLWLEKARSANWTEARIVMHGMRNADYDKLASDIAGFDFNFSAEGAKKWGFYCACSDHVASHYHNEHRTSTMPRGTACIGLLLCKRTGRIQDGSFEHYHLGFGGGHQQYGHSTNDSYAVRDQLLWLPLGLAHAK